MTIGHQIHHNSIHLTIMCGRNAARINHLTAEHHSGAKNCAAANIRWLAADILQSSKCTDFGR